MGVADGPVGDTDISPHRIHVAPHSLSLCSGLLKRDECIVLEKDKCHPQMLPFLCFLQQRAEKRLQVFINSAINEEKLRSLPHTEDIIGCEFERHKALAGGRSCLFRMMAPLPPHSGENELGGNTAVDCSGFHPANAAHSLKRGCTG